MTGRRYVMVPKHVVQGGELYWPRVELPKHSEFPLGRSTIKGFASEGLDFDYRFVI
jgi:hypothetical protein